MLFGCGSAEVPSQLEGEPTEVGGDRISTPAPAPPQTAADDGPLTWTGCGISKKAYIAECVAKYTELTGVEIAITGGGATRGIRATAGGASDLGGTCRHSLPSQFPEEQGAVLTHVAWDALVLFTHPDNPVQGITLEQARDVLLGRVTSWDDLGGPAEEIIPVLRRQTVEGKLSGVGYMARLLLFGDPNMDYTEDALFFPSSGPVEECVETTPWAFAVTGVSSAKKRDVRILTLDGVAPTKENIASGRYPLFRPLYLVTKGNPSGRGKDFIDWIKSDDGQAVLSRAGTVNLQQGAALAEKYPHWPTDGSVVRKP